MHSKGKSDLPIRRNEKLTEMALNLLKGLGNIMLETHTHLATAIVHIQTKKSHPSIYQLHQVNQSMALTNDMFCLIKMTKCKYASLKSTLSMLFFITTLL